MELYYKDLISEEASLEKLVDDLMMVVQGADELVQAAGSVLGGEQKQEITTRLQRLKESCRLIERQAMDSARAIDKVMRQYPYFSLGFAFALGLVAGGFIKRRR